jgi:molybdenum cofactor biosynthesis protein A
MPEEGLQWLDRAELLTYEEMLRLSRVLVSLGIEKMRITGGEPFVRKGMMGFLASLSQIGGLKQISITTNGVLTAPLVPELKKLGIQSVNLSLDTLDRNRFFAITHRDEFENVANTLDQLVKHGIGVKINAVVMDGKNTQDILPLAELTKNMPVDVRFIEEMPFNGRNDDYKGLSWDHLRILQTLQQQYPQLQKIPDPASSTAYNYHVPGHKGNLGIIAAYTRSFCGSCNRIRITPQGMLKTCLYGHGELDVRALLRSAADDTALLQAFTNAVHKKPKDGWDAEAKRNSGSSSIHESMAMIGG